MSLLHKRDLRASGFTRPPSFQNKDVVFPSILFTSCWQRLNHPLTPGGAPRWSRGQWEPQGIRPKKGLALYFYSFPECGGSGTHVWRCSYGGAHVWPSYGCCQATSRSKGDHPRSLAAVATGTQFAQSLLCLELLPRRCCDSFPIETGPSRLVQLQHCQIQRMDEE